MAKEELLKLPVADRLVRGAGMLGTYYRMGKFCETAGWYLMKGCRCESQTIFCKARTQWLDLLRQSDTSSRHLDLESSIGLIQAMTIREFEESQLTIVLDNGIKIGGKNGTVQAREAVALSTGATPEDIAGLENLIKAFPGARILKTKPAEAAAQA